MVLKEKENNSVDQDNTNKNHLFIEKESNHLLLRDDASIDTDYPNKLEKSLNVEKLRVTNSSNIHIGTKIDGNNITIVQTFDPSIDPVQIIKDNQLGKNYTNNDDKDKLTKIIFTRKAKIILCLTVGLVVILAIVIVLIMTLGKRDNIIHNVTTTAPTTTTTILPTMTTILPPSNWFINTSQWSDEETPTDPKYSQKVKKMLSFDDTQTEKCTNINDCIQVLKKMQLRPSQENNTNYNYFVGGDGRIYEGRGNDLESDIKYDYSKSIIKIAFIGKLANNETANDLQGIVLKRLLHHLIDEQQLDTEYKVMPQCCRYIPEENGPSPNLKDYLRENFKERWSKTCPCANQGYTEITTSAPWW